MCLCLILCALLCYHSCCAFLFVGFSISLLCVSPPTPLCSVSLCPPPPCCAFLNQPPGVCFSIASFYFCIFPCGFFVPIMNPYGIKIRAIIHSFEFGKNMKIQTPHISPWSFSTFGKKFSLGGLVDNFLPI